ncbi:2-amino-4-hydroxy-6-hydroxymethyldihydropteridine pyrophosphokinase [Frateuria sp. Soil773]|uniref:2-amino-4-hydroxy-6- hydroxymethyldihydropteridine diphosphokinase n=1 Tax=Frateuria sp. Soil773 TaxID=1736407 RepID=UPI0006FAFB99|nr:2-amino-4-hydroxy-6-hydroxymethyldihydropteridine diphosphokinase [Frateuria sp. Soil773]KRE89635.1 2-amino-4-hydroxy-6-hydroxymethyldihydropteridine pyrophosphokinase [Frateuria sp. Soil773]
MTRAYVALGSNLGDPRRQLLDAMDALAGLPGTELRARSRLYLTPPWGVLEQPPFVNAAVQLDTELPPHELLDALLAIERRAGRVRAERNGPRTLDLDLLHVEGVGMDDERLILPHPRIGERAFVLLPLHDLAPDLLLPGQGRVADLLAAVDTSGCTLLP